MIPYLTVFGSLCLRILLTLRPKLAFISIKARIELQNLAEVSSRICDEQV